MESLPYGGDEIDTMAMSQWKMEDLAADLGKQPEPVAVPSAPVVPHPNLHFFGKFIPCLVGEAHLLLLWTCVTSWGIELFTYTSPRTKKHATSVYKVFTSLPLVQVLRRSQLAMKTDETGEEEGEKKDPKAKGKAKAKGRPKQKARAKKAAKKTETKKDEDHEDEQEEEQNPDPDDQEEDQVEDDEEESKGETKGETGKTGETGETQVETKDMDDEAGAAKDETEDTKDDQAEKKDESGEMKKEMGEGKDESGETEKEKDETGQTGLQRLKSTANLQPAQSEAEMEVDETTKPDGPKTPAKKTVPPENMKAPERKKRTSKKLPDEKPESKDDEQKTEKKTAGKRSTKEAESGENGDEKKEKDEKGDGEGKKKRKVGGETMTFARRVEPKGEFSKLKWNVLKEVFGKIIKPKLTTYSLHEDFLVVGLLQTSLSFSPGPGS